MMGEAVKSTEYNLEPNSELRFEIVTKNDKVVVELKSGFAELFGTELDKGKPYKFTTGAKVAIFTYHGCQLEIKGRTDVSYVAKETPMVQYRNSHDSLEKMREIAEKNSTQGPIVMVVGPSDVGKSTLCRIFLNYAVRVGRRPMFVDLDVGQGSISIPGSIGAVLVERPADLEEGFSQQAPLVYHFGHKGPSHNDALYRLIISKLAEVTLERLLGNTETNASGIIINTCGWVKGNGYKYLLHAFQAFEVGTIFVLGEERLYNELLRDIPSFAKVVLLPKSGGVVERSDVIRGESRDIRIKEYFYGQKSPLYPHSFDVKWADLKIFKVGAPSLPASCMLTGKKNGKKIGKKNRKKLAEDNMTKLVAVQPSPMLLHHILAVSFAERIDDVIQSNVASFICVTHVDCNRQIITVLSPQPRPLPNCILLMSELQFKDTH